MGSSSELYLDLDESENSTRRSSNTSFEAWPSQFSGLHRPRGIDVLQPYDLLLFTLPRLIPAKDWNLRTFLKFQRTLKVEIYGKRKTPILTGIRRRNIAHPFYPPISVTDKNGDKILAVSNFFPGIKFFWENPDVQILSSTGLIGHIKIEISQGVKSYEIVDSYRQSVFHITPNLAPHCGLQLLILGAERSLLLAALMERNEDFILEMFKPLSPNLKAMLVSFSLLVLFDFGS